MAKISQLPPAAALSPADTLPIVQGADTRSVQVEALRAALAALLQPLVDEAEETVATIAGILSNVAVPNAAAVWQAPNGAIAGRIDARGAFDITLARIEQLRATYAVLQRMSLVTMAGAAEQTSEVRDPIAGVVSYLAAPGGEVVEMLRPDGSRFIALLETLFAKVATLTAGSVSAGQTLLAAEGTVHERREISAGSPGAAWVDAGGRAPLLLGAEIVAQQRGRDAAQRGRTACAGSWLVNSKRRGLGRNQDLVARHLGSGQTVRLTADPSDTFDYADPVIVGSWCYLTRWAGESATRLAVPLGGPTNGFVLQRPVAQIASYGDSFSMDGQQLAAELTAAGGHRFLQLPQAPDQFRGFGGRSLSGTVASFLGGVDPANGVTYTGNPQDAAAILLITDDHNPNDGLSDTPAIIAKLRQFFEGQRTAERQAVLMMPGLPLGGIGGSASRATWDAREAALAAAFPAAYVDVLPIMQAAVGTGYMRSAAEGAAASPAFPADSAARDQQYVDAGLWPASCYANPGNSPTAVADGHPSVTKGTSLYRKAAADFIIAKGWHL